MRTVSSTLLAAQKSASRKPYVVVEYYSDGSWQSLTSVVLAATHVQEDYHSGLSVLINNQTNVYKDLSIRGKKIRIGHGFVTSAGNEYSYAPILWVEECGPSTREGHNRVVIKAFGIWDRLANSYPAEEVKYNESSDTHTIKAIISDILYRATGEYIGTDISIDSIVDTRYVKFTLSLDRTYAEQILELLANTECELLPVDSQLCLIHPQDSDASVYTYDSNHVISANARRVALFKPNKVTVLSIQADGTQVSGTYTDSETGSLMTYEEYKYTSHYWGITSQALCESLAEDFVLRMKRRGNKGEALTKVNCGQELWDVVTITDKWTGNTFTSRVGRIEINYSKFNDQGYMMRLGFGAWTETNAATDGGEAPAASDFVPDISGQMISPYSLEPWLLRKYLQPYTCTVAPDSSNASYTWEVVYWLSGDINFADGTKLTISAGNLNLTSAGYGDNPVLLYFKEGNATLQHTSNWMTAMAPGCGVVAVVQRSATTDIKASWDANNAKAGIFNVRLLMADMILANHIKAGELVIGGKVTGNLDNVSDGTTYQRTTANEKAGAGYAYSGLDSYGRITKYVAGTSLEDPSMTGKSAGLYFTGSKMGYWDGSGWALYFASSGDGYFKGNIYASTIVSGYTLTVSGTLSAGGGNVILDSNGIVVKGDGTYVFNFKDSSGNLRARIKTGSTGWHLESASGDIWMWPDTGYNVKVVGAVIPSSDNVYALGKYDIQWANVYTRKVQSYGSALTLKAGGSYPDIIIEMASGNSVYPAANNAYNLGSGFVNKDREKSKLFL